MLGLLALLAAAFLAGVVAGGLSGYALIVWLVFYDFDHFRGRTEPHPPKEKP